MSITKLVIDQKKYGWDSGGCLILEGWKAVDSEEQTDFQVMDENGAALAAKYEIRPRPDVARRYPKYAHQQDQLGFRLVVPKIEPFFTEHQRLTVLLTSAGQSRTVFSKTAEEMKRDYYETSIRYFFDVCGCLEGMITFQGWIVDITGECFPQITDEDGNALPVQPERSIRRDLVDALELDRERYEDHAWGFSFTMPLADVRGSGLLFQMKNPYTEKKLHFSLNRLKWMSTRAGKFQTLLTRMTPGRIQNEIREFGAMGFVTHMLHAGMLSDVRYETWRREHSAKKAQLRRQRKERFSYEPVFSFVIPLYNTPEQYLKELLDSILSQTYQQFEVCLADGSTRPDTSELVAKTYGEEDRIRLQRLKRNGGISENTNAAIRMAKGEFLVFADHDDFLEPDALYELVRLLNEKPDLDIIYTDEDLTDETSKHFSSPRFKPDFNPDFLRSINYICHLTMVRKSLAYEAGLLRKQCDGAQDHDFLLRCIEQTDRVGHIPKVLYHWRAYSGSTAGNQDSKQYAIDAGKLAVSEHYVRLGYQADVEYTGIFILYKMMLRLKENPLVTILIPNKDMRETLDQCIRSIFEKTDYPNYEILIVENNSEEADTFAYYETMQQEHENFRVVTYKGAFNYSAINNLGVRHARGEYVLFLNNDTEVISPFWIREMLGFCQREDTAAVGAKLCYPDDQVQHAGVVIGLGNFAGHVLSSSPRHADGYFGRLRAIQDISAVTAACMLVKRQVFEEIGGFDEDFVVSLNDVDLCLRMREKGYLIVMDPNVELYHYESKSRGYENTPEKQERFKQEILRFRERWKELLDRGDPYYSPNLTIMDGNCGIRQKNEVPEVWRQLFGE
ncbi:MAG: glycosyltransferase family 2 protein [Lachnospiraceae bacterium]|nr:glycosyltransferase family 2 protein [Lachnospiraceae bacterium]